MSITGRCLRPAASTRRPRCRSRFGAISREMILERVENAKREAGPDRRTEIKRHPGDLVLPLSKVVRHDPTRAHIMETLERFQKLAAIGKVCLPSAEIHRYVDGHEKGQITCDPDDRDREDQANRTVDSGSNRQRPIPTTKKATAHIEFSMALPR